MNNESIESPIAFIIFNRPKQTQVVFEAIRQARPKQLLIIADGPRAGILGEAEKCEAAKDVVKAVDWPCEVHENYSEINLGCAERVISGLDWAFDIVDELIILEDDCLPNQSFFTFCDELLVRYRDDARISSISGSNLVGSVHPQYSYCFSQVIHIWGWATWKDKWSKYDRNLTAWPDAKRDRILREILDESSAIRYWTKIFDSMHEGTGPKTWDYQWHYTSIVNNWLTVVPKANLISNIGFGPTATHTVDRYCFLAGLPTTELVFPLVHPPYVLPLRSRDNFTQREVFVPPLRRRLRRKMMKVGAILSGK